MSAPCSVLADLVRRYGWAATSVQTLNPGLDVWLGTDAAVAYRRVARWPGGPRVRVTAGGPLAAPDRLVAVRDAFEADARRAGDGVLWFGVERADALAHGHAALVVGAQPVWDPAAWAARFDATAGLRAQRNRARNKGLEVTERSGDPSADLAPVLAAWLQTRGLPVLGFLTDPLVLDLRGGRRAWTATRDGRIEAYAIVAPIPARDGWLVEWVVRRPGAPNGVATLLVDHAVRTVAAEGARLVTLGLVPLARHAPPSPSAPPRATRAALWWTRAHSRRFYNFEGLERFKAKFRPDAWEPVWALSPSRHVGLTALYAIAGAFAPDRRPVRLVARALGEAVQREAHAAADWLSRRRGS